MIEVIEFQPRDRISEDDEKITANLLDTAWFKRDSSPCYSWLDGSTFPRKEWLWWNVMVGPNIYVCQFRGKRITEKDKQLALDLCYAKYGNLRDN